jgi:hypothetical protein
MPWPFGRRRGRRPSPTTDAALAEVRLERERLKLELARQVDPEVALTILASRSRGAQQTFTRQPSQLEQLGARLIESKLLEPSDGFSTLQRTLAVIREVREEVVDPEEQDTPSGALQQALSTFGPILVAGLAGVLNPAGYQAAMAQLQAAQQPQPTLQITETLPASLDQPASAPALAGPEPAAEIAELAPEEASNVTPLPIRPATVLHHLQVMPPASFARWALGQPAVGSYLQALATVPDDQLWAQLANLESNWFLREWKDIFGWLRANPERASAVVLAIRAMCTPLPDEDSVAL